MIDTTLIQLLVSTTVLAMPTYKIAMLIPQHKSLFVQDHSSHQMVICQKTLLLFVIQAINGEAIAGEIMGQIHLDQETFPLSSQD